MQTGQISEAFLQKKCTKRTRIYKDHFYISNFTKTLNVCNNVSKLILRFSNLYLTSFQKQEKEIGPKPRQRNGNYWDYKKYVKSNTEVSPCLGIVCGFLSSEIMRRELFYF